VDSRKPKSRALYGKLPREVEDEISAIHMSKVWELLEEKFCFNVKAWKKEFYEYYQTQPHSITEREAFVDFGVKQIQPVLNIVLKRNAFHPTWKNMLTYVVKRH
jgi:hypothetical protein